MSSFTDALVTRHENGKLYVVTTFRFFFASTISNLYAKVESGMQTDLVTTFWFMGWFLPKIGKHDRTGALHDSLYAQPYLYSMDVNGEEEKTRVSKFICDYALYEAARVDKVPRWRGRVMFIGLTLFGWPAWWLARYHERKELKDTAQ